MRLRLIFLIAILAFSAEVGTAQNANAHIVQSLLKHQLNNSQDVWRISSEHTSNASKVHHIYFHQLVNDIPILGTESSVHISESGTLLFENIQFLPNDVIASTHRGTKEIAPQIMAQLVAMQLGYVVTGPIEVLQNKQKKHNEIWLSTGGISEREMKAELVYLQQTNEPLRLVWKIDILEVGLAHWWEVYADANTGIIIKQEDRMQSCYSHEHGPTGLDTDLVYSGPMPLEEALAKTSNSCTECYEVFEFPLESPYFGERTTVLGAANAIASPFGWHDTDGIPGADSSLTMGNNVDAYEGNFTFGYHPDGGATLDFTGYDFDTEYTITTLYTDASITNLFYWTNIIHDITYQYGFDEEAGNFQHNNYGRGGEQFDPITAQGQSTRRRCNASFSTPVDGESPLMIINVCDTKDGDFDSTVIAHEFGHGLANRLSGGGVFDNCLRNVENPSEGWCDWLGIILTMKPEHTSATPRTIANYLSGQGANGPGIRTYPYSADMNVNPQTYASLPSESGVHRIGAVWGEALWEVTSALTEVFGFNPDLYNFTGDPSLDAGNVMAMAVVIEGLKLTPCQPGFIDARDGILMAAEAIYGAEVVCVIWNAFAKRGYGILANQGSSQIKNDQIVSFRTPLDGPIFEAEYDTFCLTGGIYESLSGGLPLGGFYSGPGVIDNGDGATFNFDPSVAGVGTHTVTYNYPETICAPAFQVRKNDLLVEVDTLAPITDCVSNVAVQIDENEVFLMPDYRSLLDVTDDCPGDLVITQFPEVGTQLDVGLTEISLVARDAAGNNATCTFQLVLSIRLEEESGFPPDLITIYPNPSRGRITILNTFEQTMKSIEIRDMQGRLVQEFKIQNTEKEQIISVAGLSSGAYFLTVNLSKSSKVFRLLKL